MNIKADYINVDVVGLKGQIIYSMAVKAHFSKSSAYIEKLTDAVRHAVDYVGADADDILGVGITVPGILDDEKQILISAPPLKAKNYDFTRLISAIDLSLIHIYGNVTVKLIDSDLDRGLFQIGVTEEYEYPFGGRTGKCYYEKTYSFN